MLAGITFNVSHQFNALLPLAPLSPSAYAYKVFKHRRSGFKLEYLIPSTYLVEGFTDHQNLIYSNLGIQGVVTVMEFNENRDTVAIRKYDSEGFLVQRDTFGRDGLNNKFNGRWLYEYDLKEKKIKELWLSMDLKSNSPYQTLVYDHYFDNNNMLTKTEHFVNSDSLDVQTTYVKADTNDLRQSHKMYNKDQKLRISCQYSYEFDKKGRLTGISYGCLTGNLNKYGNYYDGESIKHTAKDRSEDNRGGKKLKEPTVADFRSDGHAWKLAYDKKKNSVKIYVTDYNGTRLTF